MKTSAVSLTVWFAHVLTLCALHEKPLTTRELDVSTTTSAKPTTNQDVRTKTATGSAMTTTTPADESLSDLTPPVTPAPELRGFPSTAEDDRRMTTFSTSPQNITSPYETSVSTKNMRVTTEQQKTGSGTESASINIQESTEISAHGTSVQLDHEVQRTTSTSWTEGGTDDASNTAVPQSYSTYQTDVTPTNTSYGTTHHQHPPPTTAQTSVEIRSTNQTPPDDTTNTDTPTGTSGQINITATSVPSTQVTSGSSENTELDIMDWTTEENTEEPVVSSTKIMDWTTEENTEALTTSQGTAYESMTNTTLRDRAWSTNTEDTGSTNTIMSKNISTSETKTPLWTTCFSKDSSPQPLRFSKLVCFITMWTLAMVASIFLGLTVFLWVRLSITKKRARLRGRGQGDRKGQGPAAKEKDSLWVEPGSSTEERVEFWYASGATVEEDRRRQARTRKNEQRHAGTEEDMWIQPKVTLKDITEFWYANGRVRHTEESHRMRERDGGDESEDEGHAE